MQNRRTRVAAVLVGGLLLLGTAACSKDTKNDIKQLGSDVKSDVKSDASQADDSFDSFTSSVGSEHS
jgi:hypothetical protein